MIGGLIRKGGQVLLAGASAIAILASSAFAAQAATMEELEAAIADLQRQVNEAKAAASAAQAAAANSGGGGLDLKVKWKGAPEFTSGDGEKFKFKVRGRLMTDYNGIDQDEPITGEGDISAVELRRARLGVEGVVWYDWKYKFEIDFAGDDVAIKDAYVAYANWINGIEMSEVRAGNQYVYTSLEQMTSSRFITFMERTAFTDAFLPSVEADRQIGAAVLLGNEHWSFQSGYYGASTGEANDMPGQEEFDTDKMSASVRGTVAPINREVNGVNQVLHFGGSYRHRDAGTLNDCGEAVCDDLNAFYQYRARGADLHLADRFVDTPQIFSADDMFVLEAAFVWGPFSMQGEYAQLEADIPANIQTLGFDADPRISPTYNGWYVDASWYLTGETRNYEAAEGIFGRTKVKKPVFGGSGGWGAWQIAGRYDVIDLSDKAANIGACTECGEQETWLVGVNWLLTDYTAIKLNVTQSKITGGNNAPRGSGDGFNRNDDAEITGVGLRAQVDW
jgi:phosphate-selective porin OprO and OprP